MSNQEHDPLTQLKMAYESGAIDEATYNVLAVAYTASQSGSGAIAQGDNSKSAGERGVITDKAEVVQTGDDARAVKAENYIENQYNALVETDEAVARTRYLTRLLRACNVLHLAALGGEEDEATLTLEDVYISLNTTTRVPVELDNRATETSISKIDVTSLLKRSDQAKERILGALEGAAQRDRLLLLGDPGSGKSTFVRRLAALHANAFLNQDVGPPDGWEQPLLPLVITLHELLPSLTQLNLMDSTFADTSEAFVSAFSHCWQTQLEQWRAQPFSPIVEDALESGTVLLIFDGLDEVPEARRSLIRDLVHAILMEYPKLRQIIVTCRIRSYESDLLPRFKILRLARFSDEKIRDFIEGWYRTQAQLGQIKSIEVEEKIADLQDAALSQDLRELAENPMLLTTMTLIHQKEVGLPKERVRLYNLAVQVLLHRWQRRRSIPLSDELETLLKDERKLRLLLENIAYDAHQRQAQARRAPGINPEASNEQQTLSRGYLLTLLERREHLGNPGLAGEFLDYVDQRAGLLVGQGGRMLEEDKQTSNQTQSAEKPASYAFPHRTFQEYLAGCHMIRGRRRERTTEFRNRAQEQQFWAVAAQMGAEELYYVNKDQEAVLDLAYDLGSTSEPAIESSWRLYLWSAKIAKLVGKETVEQDTEYDGDSYMARLRPRLVTLLEQNALPPLERVEAGQMLAHLGDPRIELLQSIQMAFCWVPAGTFTIGAKKEEPPGILSERPAFDFELPYPYALGRYPVTNAQFDEFVRAGGYSEERYWAEAIQADHWQDGTVSVDTYIDGEFVSEKIVAPHNYGAPFNLPNHPVVGISWYEALAYCCWLHEQFQSAKRMPKGWQVTLPNEPEWEKAARGGHKLPSQAPIGPWSDLHRLCSSNECPAWENNPQPHRTYPWGDQIEHDCLNYVETEVGTTSTPGAFPKGSGPYGVQDLAGNVWEWNRSVEEDYPYPPDLKEQRGREDLNRIDLRVLRGGSFANGDNDVRGANRYRDGPYYRSYNIGFRCVVSPFPLRTEVSEQ
ncbi:SUMF1/EgtB/PvdO family nonheme iron enzyme [Chloroflexi bacterium TSY]|nr:SUMF1/EgtB/PvdO family nonheme iron enzyme [Chloroflexi bacterium TSY]